VIVWAGAFVTAPLAIAGLLYAQESPLPPLVNAGVLGALAVCFIVGLIVPKAMLDRAEARADRAEERAEQMLDHYREVVTVLQSATTAITTVDQARQAQMQQDAELRVLLSQVRDQLAQGRRT
jgi:hypothetical protein